MSDSKVFPSLSIVEWVTFCALAAILSIVNVYTTIVVGWGDGGSIIAVIASVMVVSGLFKRKIGIQGLNIGQTLVSAGGSIGFSVANYAAIKLIDPKFNPSAMELTLLFVGLGMLGTLIGSLVRKQMVKYYFPSGTACAVIQRTVASDGIEDKRPTKLLAVWGAFGALATIPTKITFTKGASPLVSVLGVSKGFAILLDPLLVGIGVVVGPKVGIGILLGGLVGGFIIPEQLQQWGMTDTSTINLWKNWAGIAMLTLPTFVAIGLGLKWKKAQPIPDGFPLGDKEYAQPGAAKALYMVSGVVGLAIALFAAHQLFAMPWYVGVLAAAVAIPLCIINGRVTGETDINPVRLVAIAMISLFVIFMSSASGNAALFLIACAIVGGTLASIAVDIMQDYRTGYLVNGNPTHQTSVQLLGAVIGALAAVPFILFLDGALAAEGAATAFVEGSKLQMPGARVWASFAQGLSGDAPFTREMVYMIVGISIAGSIYAYFAVHPKTSKYLPSLFGIGIGLILAPIVCNTIFVGAVIRWAFIKAKAAVALPEEEDFTSVSEKASGENGLISESRRLIESISAARERITTRLQGDMLLIGSAIFAASGLTSILLIGLTQFMKHVLGFELFFYDGQ